VISLQVVLFKFWIICRISVIWKRNDQY